MTTINSMAIAAAYNQKVDELNDRLNKMVTKMQQANNLHDMEEALKSQLTETEVSNLRELEKQYARTRQKEIFAECAEPIDVIKTLSFEGITHNVKRSKVKESYTVVTSIAVGSKLYYLDMKTFCKEKGYNTDWYYEAIQLSKLVGLAVAKGIGKTAKEIKQMDDSYYMGKLVEKYLEEHTDISKRSINKSMQEIFYSLTGLDEEERKAYRKIVGKDIEFYRNLFLDPRQKKPLENGLKKPEATVPILMQVYHAVLTDKEYELRYRTKKEKESAPAQASKPAEPKKEEAAPEAAPQPAPKKSKKTASKKEEK